MMLYIKYMLIHFKSAMQYPFSFVMLILYGALVPIGNIFIFYFLFERFGNIKGFTINEVIFCFSVAFIGFSLSETFFRGFDIFSRQIRDGNFDRVLTRPRTAFLQVLGSDFGFTRIGRSAVAVAAMCYAVVKLDIQWGIFKIIVLLFSFLAAVTLYSGLMVLRASFCFWTVEAVEITNIVIDGGKEVASYPITIYRKGFQLFFTFIIPFACINYYPLMYLIERENNNILCAIAPLMGFAFFPPCLLVWRLGVRHYESTGS